MADVKWIKLKVGMFDGESFKRIKRAKIGGEKFRDKLTAVWFELMDFAGKCNHDGAFINQKEIPYTDLDDIATMIDREPDELELCMKFYVHEGMVEIIDDVYMLSNWMQYQNEAGLAKIREKRNEKQAKWRAKKKELALNSGEQTEDVDQKRSTDGLHDGLQPGLQGGLPSISYSISNISKSISNISKSISSNNNTREIVDISEEPEKPKKVSKKGVSQPDFDFSATRFSPKMQEIMTTWLQYKTERRDAYKPTGLKTLFTQVQNNVDKYGEQAVIDLICESISQNYKGIIWDKLKNRPVARQHNAPAQQTQQNAGMSFMDMVRAAENGGHI